MLYDFALALYIFGLIFGFAGFIILLMTIFNSDRFRKVYARRRPILNTIAVIASIFLAVIVNSAVKSKDFPQLHWIIVSLIISATAWLSILYYAIKIHKRQPKRTIMQTMLHMRKSSIQ